MREFLYSTRFRLTLWYTIILALVLLVFSGIVYEAVNNDLNNATYTNLRSRLTQVAGTYNSQTGRLSLALDGGPFTTNVKGRTIQNRLAADEIVLLITPQGQVLQGTQYYEDKLSVLATGTAQMWVSQKDQMPYLLENPPLGPIGTTNMQAYEFGGLQFYPLPNGSYEFDQAAIVNQQQQVVALLVVGIPSDNSNRLRDLLSVLAMTLPLMILLSSTGGYWLAGRAMRPVQAITRTARQISETDLHRRLKLKQRDELGELAATFDGMLDRLEAAFERQRQFTADASHELRTPLSIVDLEAERALAKEHTSQEYRQVITTIQEENRRMTRLVNDLLVLARADASQTRLRHEPVDLSEVVVDTVERLALVAKQNGIVITVAPLPELTILGDRIYVVQMLTNIIENALKYSSSTGTRVEVELIRHDKHGQGWAELRVRDDGPGIAKEHLSHLFERFYRVDQTRTHTGDSSASDGATGGNGLGLSIAQWIAQAHGGEIQVRSAPGHGSVFAVWLPLEPAGAAGQTNFHTFHTNTVSKHKEATGMSHQMDYTERSHEEPSPYATGYQETPGFNSYATGQGMFSAGQKLSGSAGKTSTASQRLALAIVSLVLWVITLFGTIGIAIAAQAGPSAGVYILLIMVLFSMLIAVINVVYNRSNA